MPTLGRAEKLKQRKRIEALFAKGQKLTQLPYRVFYALQPAADGPDGPAAGLQFGTGAGKRHFKKAVDRNRIKRLTREAFRLEKAGILETLLVNRLQLQVFFIYTAAELPSLDTCRPAVAKALQKIAAKMQQAPAAADKKEGSGPREATKNERD